MLLLSSVKVCFARVAASKITSGRRRGRLGLRLSVAALLLVLAAGSSRLLSAPATEPAGADVAQALRDLKTANPAGRQNIYDLLSDNGDASLIPALNAYKNGSLQLIDGKQLAIYGERVDVPGQGSMLPLLDALTGKQLTDSSGKPVFLPKVDLSNAIKAPPRSERAAINDLVSSLSLLDPDPAARVQSIRDVGERANRAFIDTEDQTSFANELKSCSKSLTDAAAGSPADVAPLYQAAISAIEAAVAERSTDLLLPAPDGTATSKVKLALMALKGKMPADSPTLPIVATTIAAATKFGDRIDAQAKTIEDLKRYGVALRRQLAKDPNSRFAPSLKEALECIDLAIGDRPARLAAAGALGEIGSSRAANVLEKAANAAHRTGDLELESVASKSLASAQSHQQRVRFLQYSFAGLSAASILILLALGLSIIFGLMGVINMAHGEFMMIGAFATFVVAECFHRYLPGAYDYYLIAAVPAAFIVSGVIGYVVEWLVIRHLYGRPLDSLLATWGIGLVLIQTARKIFGDNCAVKSPSWMEGGIEITADLTLPLIRIYIILFCVVCIALVYLLVNRTKLGLLLRATTQNREMAAALGVTTRRVDGLTFAFGCGLAGLAGVVVPLYNKINPNVGQEYIVDSFMVVVTGGVGKLAGAIWAGLGLGFLTKYLEPLLGSVHSLASGASVIGKVMVLALIVVFLQWRPSGLFPPKGRMSDA